METVLRAIFMHIGISKNEPFASPGAPAGHNSKGRTMSHGLAIAAQGMPRHQATSF